MSDSSEMKTSTSPLILEAQYPGNPRPNSHCKLGTDSQVPLAQCTGRSGRLGWPRPSLEWGPGAGWGLGRTRLSAGRLSAGRRSLQAQWQRELRKWTEQSKEKAVLGSAEESEVSVSIQMSDYPYFWGFFGGVICLA